MSSEKNEKTVTTEPNEILKALGIEVDGETDFHALQIQLAMAQKAVREQQKEALRDRAEALVKGRAKSAKIPTNQVSKGVTALTRLFEIGPKYASIVVAAYRESVKG